MKKHSMMNMQSKIPLTEKERRDVKLMCNLSEGIEEKAEFILNMHREGFSLEQIARVARMEIEEIKTIIKEVPPSC